MSKADPVYTMRMEDYDAATLALGHAIAILHCVHCSNNPENISRPTQEIALDALDGATELVERARELLCRPTPPESNGAEQGATLH